MRRFELAITHGTRFWEAKVDGCLVRMRWGETDAPSKTLDRDMGSAPAAAVKLAELVTARLAEGYVEVTELAAFANTAKPATATPLPWSARFERGPHYLVLTLIDRTVRVCRGERQEIADDREVDSSVEHPTPGDARDIVERIARRALMDGFHIVRDASEPRPAASHIVNNAELEASQRQR